MTDKTRRIITILLIIVAIPIAVGSFLVAGFIGPVAVIFVVGYILGVYVNEKK